MIVRQRFQKGKVSTPRDFTRDFSRVQNVDNSVKSLSSGSGQAFRQRKDRWNKDFRSKSRPSFNQSEKFSQKRNSKPNSEFIKGKNGSGYSGHQGTKKVSK